MIAENRGYNTPIFGRRAQGRFSPARGKIPLYHIASLFVKRKSKQKIILFDPEICIILPIAFLMVFAYNNNCQGEMTRQDEGATFRETRVKKIKKSNKNPLTNNKKDDTI